MDLATALSGERLLASVGVAVVLLVALGTLFGFGWRTGLVAVVLAVVVNGFYPGGASGLVVDVLRPLRAATDGTAARRDTRRAGIDAAVGEADSQPAR